MSNAAGKVLQDALALSESERLELVSEIIASVDGPADADWESTWLAELDRRAEAARVRGEPAPEWTDVRARILKRFCERRPRASTCSRPGSSSRT